MRKPQITNPIICQQHQSGFALIMVLAIMLVVAIMVIASAQNISVESRLSANDADQKATLSLAEFTLIQGENQIITLQEQNQIPKVQEGKVSIFPENIELQNGESVINIFSQLGKAQQIQNIALHNNQRTPEYIIEFISDNHARVTARAWGRNNNTFVTLQSYVEF